MTGCEGGGGLGGGRPLGLGALVAIMALAVGLRLASPGAVEFKLDEIEPLALADEVWTAGHFPLTRGVTSFGLPGTPLLGYLLVLPRVLSADPRLAVLAMGLLGSTAVAATYLGVRRFAGERLAILSAALYAANPWAVFLTRKTWSQVLPLTTVLILWAAYEVVWLRRPRWAVAFFALLALQVQTHLVAVVYLPAALLTVLAFWPRWRHRYTAWGLALAAAILLPYVAALGAQWPATRAVLAGRAGQGLAFDPAAFRYGLWLTSGATFTALLGQSAPMLGGWEAALRAVSLLTGALLLWGLGRCAHALLRKPAPERQALLLVWLGAPLLAFTVLPGLGGIHYLQSAIPALFLLAAVGWEGLVGGRRWVSLAGAGALLATLAVQTGTVAAFYGSVGRYPMEGGMGQPLSAWLEVERGVRERAAREGWREVQIVGADSQPRTSTAAALNYLFRHRLGLRYVCQGGRRGLLVPAEGQAGALVFAAEGELRSALMELGVEEARWPVPGSEWGIRLYRLPARDPAALTAGMAAAPAGTFENGMRLLGARLPQRVAPGERLTVLTAWSFEQPAAASSADMAFNHLVDATGRRWAQDDGFALAQADWRPEETLLQWFELALPADLPAGEYWLYTGMYSWRDLSRAQLVDQAGRWLADGVRMGPVEVTGSK